MQPGSVLTPSKPKLRSNETPVGVFPLGRTHAENPAYYISIEEARSRRKTGEWYSCNSGKDIAEAGQVSYRIPEEKQHSGWKVIGQTAKNALRPGFPVWQLCQ